MPPLQPPFAKSIPTSFQSSDENSSIFLSSFLHFEYIVDAALNPPPTTTPIAPTFNAS